jgi:hypothetical protein
LLDRIDAEDHSMEAVLSYSTRPRNQSPLRSRSPPLNQLSQEDLLHTDRSAADEHEPVCPPLDTNTFGEDRRQEEEKQEASGGGGGDDDDDAQPQREMNSVEAALTAKKCCDSRLSRKKDEGTNSARRQKPLPSGDSSLEPGQDATGSYSDGCRDGELSNTHAESDEEDRRPRPTKTLVSR